ncbi:unnamed protein product, partial [marine sediment metagenome]
YCKARSKKDFSVHTADNDVNYVEELTFDFNEIEPRIALPPSPANVKPVAEVTGIKVDSVVIASCTNGRYEDFEIV